MDRIAHAVGLSPVEVRRRNFLQPGQATTTEQVVREPINLGKLLDRAVEVSDYRSKKQRFARARAVLALRGKASRHWQHFCTAPDLRARASVI